MGGPAVFGGKSNTITDYEDLELDEKLPPSGALSWSVNGIGAIKAVDGKIAGATGVDAKIIHGNLWEDIDGNQGTVITGSETRNTMLNLRKYVDQSETHIVGQNWSLTITSNGKLTVLPTGSFSENQFGPVNRMFMMPVTEIFIQTHQVTQPENFFDVKLHDNTLVFLEQVNIVIGMLTELVGFHIEVGGNHMEMKVTHPEVKLFKAYFHEGKAELGLTEAKVAALKGAVGIGANVKAMVNALASIGLVTPFR